MMRTFCGPSPVVRTGKSKRVVTASPHFSLKVLRVYPGSVRTRFCAASIVCTSTGTYSKPACAMHVAISAWVCSTWSVNPSEVRPNSRVPGSEGLAAGAGDDDPDGPDDTADDAPEEAPDDEVADPPLLQAPAANTAATGTVAQSGRRRRVDRAVDGVPT